MRTLEWDGYRNVRDLGGLPTPLSDTGLTKFGRIARGPRRELITAQGVSDAREWGLRSVVDIRNANEVRESADPAVTQAWDGIEISLHPTEDQSNPEFQEHCMPVLDSPAYWTHNFRILPELVAGALRAVLAAPAGVLVHCGAGRDRTGMMSMLLLANAGVAPEAIAADYTTSVRAIAGSGGYGAPTSDR